MRSGITRRWLRGNLLITVLVVLLAEAMFLYSYTRSYYGSVQQIMYRRDSLLGAYLCSRDTFYCRTPERDRQYEAAFPHNEEKNGKRIPTLMYIRKYID